MLKKYSLAILVGTVLLAPTTSYAAEKRTPEEHACFQSYWQKKYDAALRACRIAANQGSVKAQVRMALFYYEEVEGLKQDFEEARQWFEKAAVQGDMEAMVYMAEIYRYGKGVEQSMEKAAEWYHKAADAGHHDSQFELAKLYYRGKGVPLDFSKAAYYVKQSAENSNNLEANYMYATMLENGQGVEQSSEKAAELFYKGASKGQPPSLHAISRMYRDGQGVEKNEREAAEWIVKAATLGDAVAQHELAQMHRDGKFVEKSDKLAEEWEQKAFAQNHPPSIYFYAQQELAKDEKSKKALELIQNAAALDYGPALVKMGDFYMKGIHFDVDYVEASEYYVRAMKENYGPGIYEVAKMHKTGRGLGKDMDKAAELFMRAAKLGVGAAQYEVGELYKEGVVLDKDILKAYGWFKLSDDNQYEHAGFSLAMTSEDMTSEEKIKGNEYYEEINAMYGNIKEEYSRF